MHTRSPRTILLRSLTLLAIVCGTVATARGQFVDPFEVDEILIDIAFRNEHHGYAIGEEYVWHTSDAGSTWTRTMPLGFRPPFTTFALFGESGFIIGDAMGGIHLTDHPDSIWHTIPGDGHSIREIEVIDRERWVAITDSLVMSTRDGGKTFSRFAPNDGRARLTVLDVTDESLMHIDDSHTGEVWRSTDGGTSWEVLEREQFGHIYDIRFISADTGFVASWYPWFLYTTVDGGKSWSAGPFEYPTSIAITRGGFSAYTAGDYVRLSIDGGMTWTDSVALPVDPQWFDYGRQQVVTAGPNKIFAMISSSDPVGTIIARVDVTSDVQSEERPLPEKFDLSLRE